MGMGMEDPMENAVRRLERLKRLLSGAAAILAIGVIVLLIIDLSPS